ncbi:hypothetical protein BDD14_6407 [Edaphobacter modestus]|uniref:Uncharacterized protein n=2 Tax=Edaphobacter modestus TaxID=388466 RepID=A0A4Q7XZD0_9BACT|nr:hypothetical protein BDD14_6407 [Edaphobacter modestus]
MQEEGWAARHQRNCGMADMTGVEKRVFEKVLRMGDGYVMGFNNGSFGEGSLNSLAFPHVNYRGSSQRER